jgi:hypothetical protein
MKELRDGHRSSRFASAGRRVPAVARSYNVKSFTKYQTRHARNPIFDNKPLIISMLPAIESSAFRGLNGPCGASRRQSDPFHHGSQSLHHTVDSPRRRLKVWPLEQFDPHIDPWADHFDGKYYHARR